MAVCKIRTFISDLRKEGRKHPFYQEVYLAVFQEHYSTLDPLNNKQVKKECELWSDYFNLLVLLNKNVRLSKETLLHEELKNVISGLKAEVSNRQRQLTILQSLLNYAKLHFDIDSPNVPAIVTLKREKPLLSPVDLTKLIFVEKINSILQAELISPARTHDRQVKIGRLFLILYWTVNIEKTEHLCLMLAYPKDIFYVGGICYWQCQTPRVNSPRYVLNDMAVMALQQWHLEHYAASTSAIKSSQIKPALVRYLNQVSHFDWSDMSILKLRVIRRIDTVLRYGPVQYQMYILPGVCQSLPIHSFLRLMTGKACAYAEPNLLDSISEKTKALREWSQVANGTTCFVPMSETLKQLDKVFSHLIQLESQKATRTDCLNSLAIILEQSSSKMNPCFWILCAWLYSLLKVGGTIKRRLKISTTIDYVRSLSRPFLLVFCTSDISLLSGAEWTNKLNEATDHFSSPKRRIYVYYFAKFLVDSGFSRDLCLSDIEVVGSSSEVDANLITVEHAQVILSYLGGKSAECLVHRDAFFLLCFCFYSGLRRNEAAKLTWGDFSFSLEEPSMNDFDYVQLSVRPNKHRSLKTTSARRELPLDALWPKTEIMKLRSFYRIVKSTGTNNSTLLFENERRVNLAYELITNLMRHYTKDHSLRIHHLRHSFANWTWCRLNPKLIEAGRAELAMFSDEIFDVQYLCRLQSRLRFSDNTRKKMFILSHMMGHKDVQSTLNSYLHLKDVLYYLQQKSRFVLTKYFTSESLGRATLSPSEPGLSLAERINYYTQEVAQKLAIKPAPLVLGLKLPNLTNFSINIKADQTISSLTWSKALKALKSSSAIDVATHFAVPLPQLQQLFTNAEAIHQTYPRRGKRLPLIPKFPNFCGEYGQNNSPAANSTKVFSFLCKKLDTSLDSGALTLEHIRLGMEIILYAVPGKDYALRCPDSKVSRMFIRLCQLLGLKARHLKFRHHSADLDTEKSSLIKARWKKTICEYGFSDTNFTIASTTEGQFLGRHDGNGFLEIALVNNNYKRVQRHQSLFSFLHFMLILSFDKGQLPKD
ncbi:tyrosine-type recombinase/integrase [Shewanella zhangzhouensis]|uniref:tyrosine-type recombinase/integrase n=1 Tax=Shewanella zhangzhouensis TaxID=2864213 RepID=UPI001C65DC09|nr:tyrosine-type recombinase/integrase [Shewanella zhangzhouensis]QYK06998.1 tyrosine-type recombinase/integrase [Shewanella zhangzhouensis]